MDKNRRLLQTQHLAPEETVSGSFRWAARKLGIPPWGQILLYCLGTLTVSLALFLWHEDKKLDKLQSAVEVLSSRMSPQDNDLILRLLSEAKKAARAGDKSTALLETRLAGTYISLAKAHKASAPDDYFDQALKAVDGVEKALPSDLTGDSPEVSQTFLHARVSLAEYRSSLNSAPGLDSHQRTIEDPVKMPPPLLFDPSTFLGTVIRSKMAEGVDFLAVSLPWSLARNIRVENITFVDGSQTLDGVHWINVVFVNTHIRYEGGKMELRGVRFVNCTFELVTSPRSVHLADYIALNSVSLVFAAPQG